MSPTPMAPLGALCHLVAGGTPSSSDSRYWESSGEAGTPWVAIGDMSRRKWVTSTSRRVSDAGLSAARLPTAPAGTVLFAMYASVGETAILNFPASWNQALLGVAPYDDSKLSATYLYYALLTLKPELPLFYRSNTQNNLNAETVARFRIPLPDLPTQRRIADYLGRETARIDAMAGALNGLVARLEDRRRGAVLDIFNTFQAPSAHLGAFCQFTSGSGFPIKYQGNTDKEYPFFKVGSLSRLDSGGFVDDRSNTISHETATLLAASIVPANSILLAKIGMAMLLGRFVRTPTECCIDNNMLAITPSPDVADSAYVQYALGLAPVKLFANPGPVPSMNVTSLRMHNIPLPPLDEQRRIADHLDAETAKIDAMIAKAGELRALLDERRSALITATVTGQHPVPKEP